MSKTFKKHKQAYNGYVYIIKIEYGAEIIYKIGTTNRTPMHRMAEIAVDLCGVIGYIPKMMLIRQKQTKDNYKIEAAILKATEKNRYLLQCNGNISGESELRSMREIELLNCYDFTLMAGQPAEIEFEVAL